MSERKPWTREELALALNLYCKLPFGKMHTHNPEIIRLAEYLQRTPGSIAMKLVNFASLDPTLKQKGLTACSKLDRQVWQEFFSDENMVERTETVSETLSPDATAEMDFSAEDVIVSTKARKLQGFFRKTILANYEAACCITGIKIPALLVASHIVPWNADKSSRINPQNGLCLNALHDRAFDKGLLTIDTSYKVAISKSVAREKSNAALLDFEGHKITLPKKFLPSLDFLTYHQANIFRD
jgi:predicted restriction endonuclease